MQKHLRSVSEVQIQQTKLLTGSEVLSLCLQQAKIIVYVASNDHTLMSFSL